MRKRMYVQICTVPIGYIIVFHPHRMLEEARVVMKELRRVMKRVEKGLIWKYCPRSNTPAL